MQPRTQQPLSPFDRFKAFLRQSAQTQLRAYTTDESALPNMKRRPDLGTQAVSDYVRKDPNYDPKTIQDFVPAERPQGEPAVTSQALEAYKRMKSLPESQQFRGSDNSFFKVYEQYGERIFSEVNKQLGSIGQGLINGTPKQYASLISQAAKQYNVPERLLSALLKQESGFNPKAVSSAGALGIAQFMPATAKGFGIDPLDPNQAIPAAAKYLRGSFDNFGSWELALAAYNAGGGAVGKYGGIPPYPETQNYVKTIMAMVGGGN